MQFSDKVNVVPVTGYACLSTFSGHCLMDYVPLLLSSDQNGLASVWHQKVIMSPILDYIHIYLGSTANFITFALQPQFTHTPSSVAEDL